MGMMSQVDDVYGYFGSRLDGSFKIHTQVIYRSPIIVDVLLIVLQPSLSNPRGCLAIPQRLGTKSISESVSKYHTYLQLRL